MDQNYHQEQESLQMKAKCALNDISNRDEGKTKMNWLSKSKTKDKNGIKLPSISLERKSLKSQFKYTPLLMRKRGNMYRQKVNQLLSDVKSKNLPNYYINKKLAEQIGSINNQNSNNIQRLSKIRRQKKCFTQQNEEYQQNQQNSNASCILKNRTFQNQSNLKRNWSVHVRKALIRLNRQKESTSMEVQSIKQLIQDKRSKCRMLSKQGYLLVKQDPIDVEVKNSRSSIEMGKEKNKSISRLKNSQYNGPKSSCSIHSNDLELGKMLQCKNFLKDACEILRIKRNPNQTQIYE